MIILLSAFEKQHLAAVYLLIPMELMLCYSKDCTESCENFLFHMTVISSKPSNPKYES